MIDAEGRRTAATLLGRFAAGTLSYEDVEAQWPAVTNDGSVTAIEEAVSYHFHDDFVPHRRNKITGPDREIIARYVGFLLSSLEYQWTQPLQSLRKEHESIPTDRREEASSRELAFWPFQSETELRSWKGRADEFMKD